MLLFDQLAKALFRRGTLTVIYPSGQRRAYGDGQPAVTIRIHDRALSRRLLTTDPSVAMGEAWMEEGFTVEGGDIYDFLDLVMRNLPWGNSAGGDWMMRLRALLRRVGRRIAQHNPIGVAQQNVAHHYDLSDDLYDLFLDSDRQYSCAYYATADDPIEAAQAQKKRHIAAKLLLQPGQKVLDIGSGWGGLGLYLADVGGGDVTGVTLSERQHAVSNRRAAELGLADRVRFKLLDYRKEPSRFDRIVSVGMFEHVGVGHYAEFFRKVAQLLTDDGVALLHTIGRADGPGATNPWITKYIFPGGYSPALSEILPHIERAGLIVTDVEVLRLHYAETLKAWRRRFNANRARIAQLYDERFCRMWEFYLAGSETTFRHGGHVVFQIQMAKQIDAVPLTRDYIGEFEAAHPLGGAAATLRNLAAGE